MGSHSGELARARHASSLLVNTLPPGTKVPPVAWTLQHQNELPENCCLSPSPGLHMRARRSDGYNDVGGVYDSAIAQDYWASRFGSGFFAGLRALQLDGEAADSGALP